MRKIAVWIIVIILVIWQTTQILAQTSCIGEDPDEFCTSLEFDSVTVNDSLYTPRARIDSLWGTWLHFGTMMLDLLTVDTLTVEKLLDVNGAADFDSTADFAQNVDIHDDVTMDSTLSVYKVGVGTAVDPTYSIKTSGPIYLGSYASAAGVYCLGTAGFYRSPVADGVITRDGDSWDIQCGNADSVGNMLNVWVYDSSGTVRIVSVDTTGALWDSLSYWNWGSIRGANGYGLRDSAGIPQYKPAGGSWANVGSGGAAAPSDTAYNLQDSTGISLVDTLSSVGGVITIDSDLRITGSQKFVIAGGDISSRMSVYTVSGAYFAYPHTTSSSYYWRCINDGLPAICNLDSCRLTGEFVTAASGDTCDISFWRNAIDGGDNFQQRSAEVGASFDVDGNGVFTLVVTPSYGPTTQDSLQYIRLHTQMATAIELRIRTLEPFYSDWRR